jgi:hypothetical protein
MRDRARRSHSITGRRPFRLFAGTLPFGTVNPPPITSTEQASPSYAATHFLENCFPQRRRIDCACGLGFRYNESADTRGSTTIVVAIHAASAAEVRFMD